MKKFEEPKLYVEMLELEDVVATSTEDTGCIQDDCYLTECIGD